MESFGVSTPPVPLLQYFRMGKLSLIVQNSFPGSETALYWNTNIQSVLLSKPKNYITEFFLLPEKGCNSLLLLLLVIDEHTLLRVSWGNWREIGKSLMKLANWVADKWQYQGIWHLGCLFYEAYLHCYDASSVAAAEIKRVLVATLVITT